jgi:EmrB/QacA subfamily drug resistance transporter
MVTAISSPKAQRLALVNVCLGQFMGALDARSVIVALPTMSVYFDTAMETIQWIPLAYQLTMIGLVLSLGRLGDRIGRKRIYGLGYLIFIVGSAGCGLSASLTQIILFRIVEGVGGAMVLANGRAIVSAVYAREGRGKALGVTSMAFHLGYIIGPSLGGLLVDLVGWRWIFFVNLPVALVATVMAWKVLQETVTQRSDYTIDPIGMVTLLGTVVALILGLQQTAKAGLNFSAVVCFGFFFLFVGLLVYFERRVAVPLLELGLFRARLFTSGIVSLFFVSLSQTATFFLLPFYLQGILRFRPTEVGITLIFFSVVIVFLAPVGGWLSDRLGSRLLCTLGSVGTVVSILLMSRLDGSSEMLAIMIPLIVMGLGWSFFQSPNLSAIFSAVGTDKLGAVSGVTLTGANVANGVGVSMASLLFASWLSSYGFSGTGVPPYTEWGRNPQVFIAAFQNSCLVLATLALIAVAASALRGHENRVLSAG